ncbi:hypothetical protein I317_03050 [Kwoniella heveanensis CBS 569]|nr:hypothetical protein I317_03050 [Kwoniella heveanensis CBS 569]
MAGMMQMARYKLSARVQPLAQGTANDLEEGEISEEGTIGSEPPRNPYQSTPGRYRPPRSPSCPPPPLPPHPPPPPADHSVEVACQDHDTSVVDPAGQARLAQKKESPHLTTSAASANQPVEGASRPLPESSSGTRSSVDPVHLNTANLEVRVEPPSTPATPVHPSPTHRAAIVMSDRQERDGEEKDGQPLLSPMTRTRQLDQAIRKEQGEIDCDREAENAKVNACILRFHEVEGQRTQGRTRLEAEIQTIKEERAAEKLSLEKTAKELQRKINNQLSTIERLTKDNDSIKNQRDSAIDTKNRTLVELKDRIDTVQKLAFQVQSVKKDNDELRNSAVTSKLQEEQLRSQYQALIATKKKDKEHELANTKLQNQLVESEKKVGALNESLEKMEHQLDGERARADKALRSVESLKEELKKEKEKVVEQQEALRTDCQTLQARADALQQEIDISKQEIELSRQQSEKKSVVAPREQEDYDKVVESLRSRAEEAERKVEDLKREVKETLDKMETEKTACDNRHNVLQIKLAAAQFQVKTNEEELAKLKRSTTELSAEKVKTEAALKKTQTQCGKITAEKTKIESALTTVKTQLRSAHLCVAAANRRADQVADKRQEDDQQIKKQLDKLEKKNKMLKAENKSKTIELAGLQKELESLRGKRASVAQVDRGISTDDSTPALPSLVSAMVSTSLSPQTIPSEELGDGAADGSTLLQNALEPAEPHLTAVAETYTRTLVRTAKHNGAIKRGLTSDLGRRVSAKIEDILKAFDRMHGGDAHEKRWLGDNQEAVPSSRGEEDASSLAGQDSVLTKAYERAGDEGASKRRRINPEEPCEAQSVVENTTSVNIGQGIRV